MLLYDEEHILVKVRESQHKLKHSQHIQKSEVYLCMLSSQFRTDKLFHSKSSLAAVTQSSPSYQLMIES